MNDHGYNEQQVSLHIGGVMKAHPGLGEKEIAQKVFDSFGYRPGEQRIKQVIALAKLLHDAKVEEPQPKPLQPPESQPTPQPVGEELVRQIVEEYGPLKVSNSSIAREVKQKHGIDVCPLKVAEIRAQIKNSGTKNTQLVATIREEIEKAFPEKIAGPKISMFARVYQIYLLLREDDDFKRLCATYDNVSSVNKTYRADRYKICDGIREFAKKSEQLDIADMPTAKLFAYLNKIQVTTGEHRAIRIGKARETMRLRARAEKHA